MKRSALVVILVVIALVAFASVALAQQASVFGDGVLVSAYVSNGVCSGQLPTPCTSDLYCAEGEVCTNFSASLEVRDATGAKLLPGDFIVTGISPTVTPVDVSKNPFLIHDSDLVNNDISITYDSTNQVIYVFCTDGTPTTPDLHVMKYSIHRNLPAEGGQCGSANGATLTSAPTTNLCEFGTAYGFNGVGPWYWYCPGANGGDPASCSANMQTWTVTPSAGTGGSISPSAPQSVRHGTTTQFTITPNTGYTATVSGCGGSPAGGTSQFTYTTSAVTSNCAVSATFAQNTGTGADLYPSYFKMPAAGSNNVGFSGYVTVANIGTGAAGPFNVKISMGGQLLTNGTQRVTSLGAGSSVTVNFSNLKFSGLALHTYYKIKVVVDADSEVGETNETNNEKTRDFEVL